MKRTVREALQHVADYPQPVDDETITMHTGELIARTLYDIANTPNVQERGSLTRANRARKMIMDRLGGKRRPGTKPVRPSGEQLLVKNLTGKELPDD
jgi:hypothetical protein